MEKSFRNRIILMFLFLILLIGGLIAVVVFSQKDQNKKLSADQPQAQTQQQTPAFSEENRKNQLKGDIFRSSFVTFPLPKNVKTIKNFSDNQIDEVRLNIDNKFNVTVLTQSTEDQSTNDLVETYSQTSPSETIKINGKPAFAFTTKAGGNSSVLLIQTLNGRIVNVLVVKEGTNPLAARKEALKIMRSIKRL